MPNFKPMLAGKADPRALRFPLLVQPKLDGIRACVVNGRLVSRTLKPIPNAEIRAFLERPEFEGFDGELMVGDPTAADAYRRTTSFCMAQNKTGEPWTFYVFDLWNSPFRCATRLSELAACVQPGGYMQPVPAVTVANAEQLESVEGELLEQGYEGAILRSPDGRYKFGRSTASGGELLKLKRFEDSEAVIIGAVEEQHNANPAMTNALGRTERSTAKAGKVGKGTLGKLLVRDRYSGVEFSIGSGFSAAERAALWTEPLEGRVVKYRFFPMGSKDRPRFPTFLGFREGADLPEGAA